MAAAPIMSIRLSISKNLLIQAALDLMRQMLTVFINQILPVQVDPVCGADYATVSSERSNKRNCYRYR